MADRTAARRYALAFISLAIDLNTVELFAEDLEEALQTVSSEKNLLFDVLCNPVFTIDERINVLNALIPGMELHTMSANVLRLLVEKGRFAVLPDMVELYKEEADIRAGRLRVNIVSADPLTDELRVDIIATLERSTGKTIILKTDVDGSLIGGMIAYVGGKVYDASVRARLDDLKYRLINGAA
ncbi:MAG: F-type H+-transporting ATPase subunit delta [Kiritimatiellia bacterium]|jgi:F-type H+-transporting ATPase subunit delta